jgi:hypothetical protein
MKYEQIEAPRAVKAGQLPICDALGAISLLPLAKPTEPKALLGQLMLDNWTPAILVEDATGDEHPIPQSFWQSSLSGQAFRGPMIEFPVRTHGLERGLVGHIVFRTAIVRRAIASLLTQPELPPGVVAALNDPDRKRMVVTGIQQGKEATFDEAVKRWQASGTAAQPIVKPMFTAKIPTPAERVARQAELQRRGGRLGSLSGSAPDLISARRPGADGMVLDGLAIRVEQGGAPGARSSTQKKPAAPSMIKDWIENKAKALNGRPPLSQRTYLKSIQTEFPDYKITREPFLKLLKASDLYVSDPGKRG